MARVLVVDDEEDLRAFLREALESAGHTVTTAEHGRAALEVLTAEHVDVLVTDLQMPVMDGETLMRQARALRPDLAMVVLTAYGSVRTAVQAMKLGALDFLEKPVESPDALRAVVARAAGRVSRVPAPPVVVADRDTDRDGTETPRLSWGAPAMNPVEAALRRVAPTETTVLLQGESGTGKEVAARALHRWSRRSRGPFVAVNCASLSDTLLESELFGHERGAFTGAVNARPGRIEAAAGGTFFLDEIGDLRIELQARLLRVIQEREFLRVGGTRALPADVRWVAATHRDLAAEVAAGRFREDLYHRLAVFPVRMPSLTERREDIGPLADALLARIARTHGRPGLRLDEGSRNVLTAMPWTGNIRELANTLERAVILSDGLVVRVTHAPNAPNAPARPPGMTPTGTATQGAPRGPTMEETEREAIQRALAQCDGNRRRAADQLGIGLRTLYDKLKKYGLG